MSGIHHTFVQRSEVCRTPYYKTCTLCVLTDVTPYFRVRKKEFQMTTATLKSKGRITIPAEVRHYLKVGAGDRVEFIQIAPGRYELVAATQSITDLKGMFGQLPHQVSIDDMNKTIAKRGATRR